MSEDRERSEIEAAVFRWLVEHLRARSDVQNIDLMNLAGFCRNCLSNWYQEAAEERGLALSKAESREIVYGAIRRVEEPSPDAGERRAASRFREEQATALRSGRPAAWKTWMRSFRH